MNKSQVASQSKVGDTPLINVSPKVLQARKGSEPTWEVSLGKNRDNKFYAWCVSAMKQSRPSKPGNCGTRNRWMTISLPRGTVANGVVRRIETGRNAFIARQSQTRRSRLLAMFQT